MTESELKELYHYAINERRLLQARLLPLPYLERSCNDCDQLNKLNNDVVWLTPLARECGYTWV